MLIFSFNISYVLGLIETPSQRPRRFRIQVRN
uniref:Uncharacterized protein n=1 Tax=Schistosoma japonicum TaxID=6182 RepID=Q5BZR7_SCHJA|nr:unknown [Schistosoma japonicum]